MSKSSIETSPGAANTGVQTKPLINGKPHEDGAPGDDSSIRPDKPGSNGDEVPGGHYRGRRAKAGPIRSLLQGVASLRLTVFLFALSIVLIFSGTLAQMDAGIGTVVKEYFRSLYVWIPLQLFVRFGQVFFGVPHHTQVSGYLPFPGGWLIGGALVVNLLAAHAVRFKLSWKRSGILILHTGLLVLMAGELLTGLFAVEGQMTMDAGGVANVIKHRESPELAVTGPLETAANEVTVIPTGVLRKGGLIQNEHLPFDVVVDEYMPNSVLKDATLKYAVPANWREGELVKSGIRRDAVFLVKDGERSAEVSITTAQGDLKANIDRWRKQLGLEPSTDEGFKRETKSLDIVGADAVYVDLVAPGNAADRPRLLGVALPRAWQWCFIVLRGPADLVGRERTPFQDFLRSLHAETRATAGVGLGQFAEPAREGAGVDAEQRIDLASAYVTLKKKGTDQSLGTYLVSEWQTEIPVVERPDQKVTVDGRTYGISLRYKREYTPYSFQLLEFHHDNYAGTDIPNNFSSQVRILDPERQVDREVNIHMNVPLRYQRSSDDPWWQLLVRGQETYYQQGFLPGDTGTILQVVRNPGWLAPYFACAMVALGMVVHFGITLYGFLRKRSLAGRVRSADALPGWLLPTNFASVAVAGAIVFALYMTGYYLPAAAGFLGVYAGTLLMLHRVVRGSAGGDEPEGFASYFPWMVVAAAALLVVVAMLPQADPAGKAKVQELAELPVQAEGRVKPLDTVARIALAGVSDLQTFKNENHQTRPAIEWLADAMTSELPGSQRRDASFDHQVFRIENDQVLTLLGLPRREGLRYSLNEFRSKIDSLAEEAEKADALPEKERSVFQAKVLELARKVHAYQQIARLATPRLVPPAHPRPNADWLTLPQAASEFQEKDRPDEATLALFATLQAYAKDRPDDFNKNLEKYRSLMATNFPDEVHKAGFEAFFNRFAPFYVCMPLYVGVFLLSALSWLGWSRPLNRAAFWLAILALVIHTFGLAARMYLQGRPPVTNLYSSAVFIAWMSVLLGLALEVIFGLGIGNALAGSLGFAGVVIAHNLASGDTLEMMRAVLDTNFWLATHVICVSIGYAATMLAGFLGILYILAGLFTRSDDRGWGRGLSTAVVALIGALVGTVAVVIARGKAYKSITQMLYGILCFATLFSFVGTVLGGIWADQSWGRFWGWDPKENGALLIVVMNALILHARWAGLVKDRGMAVLAVFGNIITGWSWFGTNQLGVGLHSYGFTSGLALTLTLFWASQVLVICLGLIPMRHWRGADDIKESSIAAARGNLGGSIA
jgi:ABC-type transport system involved in cytochrome c biogenesis permease subunit